MPLSQVSYYAIPFYSKLGLIAPLTFMQVLDAIPPSKRRIYYRAYNQLRDFGPQPYDTRVSMFVKPDKYTKACCKDKEPRAIQYRHPRFNLQLMRYIKAIEAQFEYITMGSISNTTVFAKTLNMAERADVLINKNSYFNKPVYLELDHSRFDSTLTINWIKYTHKRYLKLIPSMFFSKLLKTQLRNIGRTKSGIKYIASGTRMSGDCDTSCGNSIVNADVILYFLKRSGISKYDYLVDGDDSVVIIEAEDRDKLDFTIFEQLGFKTKYEFKSKLNHVDFCQSRILNTPQPKFVRHPHRALNNIFVCRHKYHGDQYARWLAGVGMCEASLNYDVPVLGALGQALSEISDNPILERDLEWRMTNVPIRKYQGCSPQIRAEYEDTFGISLDLQQLIENSAQVISAVRENKQVDFGLKHNLIHLTDNHRWSYEERSWLSAMDESCGSCWWGCSSSACATT